jgi:hypothetical protein
VIVDIVRSQPPLPSRQRFFTAYPIRPSASSTSRDSATAGTWQDLRLDGTCFEDEGLAPDVVVVCTAKELEAGRPILEKALAIRRGKTE